MGREDTPKKTALVTGCSEGGLGFALARAFEKKGFRVFATVRDPTKARLLAENDNIDVLRLEVTSQESIESCLAEIEAKLGGRGLDVLVNNAGAGLIMPLLDTSVEESRRLFDVNVWGMLSVTQAFVPLVIQARGTVVNISSIAGAVQMAWQGVYNSSKAAVTFLSETLRIELAPLGVRVVTAMVGEVETDFYAHSQGKPFSLPEASHYKQVEGIIAKQRSGELQVNNEKADVTARSIVEDIVSGRTGQIWRGGVAGTAKYASWLLPKALFERMLHNGRGIYDLKYV